MRSTTESAIARRSGFPEADGVCTRSVHDMVTYCVVWEWDGPQLLCSGLSNHLTAHLHSCRQNSSTMAKGFLLCATHLAPSCQSVGRQNNSTGTTSIGCLVSRWRFHFEGFIQCVVWECWLTRHTLGSRLFSLPSFTKPYLIKSGLYLSKRLDYFWGGWQHYHLHFVFLNIYPWLLIQAS